MKKACGRFLSIAVIAVGICCWFWLGCKHEGDSCSPWQNQLCYCSDGSVGLQSCSDNGSGWEACECTEYSVWCDNNTGLCWQTPQKDAYDYEDIGVVSQDAVRYCQELELGGYDDWRLPDIDELRTLIRGSPSTETGGDCPITEGTGTEYNGDERCMGGEEWGGPAPGGCYWPAELSGTCDKQDPYALQHPLEYWATDGAADDPEHWIAFVAFDSGVVGYNHVNSYGDVRCVRDAPSVPVSCDDDTAETCTPGDTQPCECDDGKKGARVCGDNGSCWGPCECTGFEPSPPITDVSEQCDTVNLTIKVPEKLSHPPYQLVAFLYAVENFPPMGPPDGGTDYNQVEYPEIDSDKPYQMSVPGCTYYREKCLNGEYHLYVALIMEPTAMPIPKEGDYYWGLDAEPLTLGSGEMKQIDMEITLEPVK